MQKIVDDVFLDPDAFPTMTYNYDISYKVSIEDSSTGQQTHSEYKQFARTTESAQQWITDKRAAIEAGLSPTQKIIADKSTLSIQPQAAMVIIDYHTGEVKALAGGRDAKTVNRGFNRATDSARQPGSVFKVLAAYAPAIDMGKITAATLIKDEYYKVGNYEPHNWWGSSYRGNCTARVGIRDSMNILAVKTMVETGLDNCYDYLLNFGFTTLDDDNHAATALGGLTNGVTQLEVAAAYGTIANQGEYKRPMLYSMVLDHDGNVLLENNSEPRQVLKATSAYILTQMMSSVVNDSKGTGTAAKFKSSSMPVVGKTGTTTNTKDLTFVGYTPYYVGSIWMGYDRYDTTVPNMDSLKNQHAHLDVWRNVMEKIHQNLEVKDFAQPDGITEVTICADTGYLPRSGCNTMTEYFADGTQPTKYCTGGGSSSDSDSSGGSSNDNNDSEGSRSSYSSDTDSQSDENDSGSNNTEQTPAANEGNDTSSEQTPAAAETPAQETPAEAPAQETPAASTTPAAPSDTGNSNTVSENIIVEPTVS
jgi:penicillin-binding protein 1A